MPSPAREKVPEAPPEGGWRESPRNRPFTGYNSKPGPHQSADGAADSFPRGGSRPIIYILLAFLYKICYYKLNNIQEE